MRLLYTQARGSIGRRLLHQRPNGELGYDSVWRWSASPDRFLSTALRLAVASNPDVRLVETSRAPSLTATLLVWNLDKAREARLVATVEFDVVGLDNVVHTHVVSANEPISAELPGDLADASGGALNRLASEGIKLVENQS